MAGTRRAAQKESTRRLLLSTALELFAAQGYAATTVDDIVEAAGTARVTFYAHFSSRSDLVRTLVEELNSFRFDPLPEEQEEPTERPLVSVAAEGEAAEIDAWMRRVASRWADIRPYLTAVHEAAIVDSELREAVDAWLDEGITDIVNGLARARRFDAEGRRVRGVMALALLDYVARHWESEHWGADRTKILDVLIETWTSLLGASPDGAAR